MFGNEGGNGYTICNDMLYFFSKTGEKSIATGWTAGCTLKALLIQMTVFFADPDYPKNMLPTQEMIDTLKQEIATYKCSQCSPLINDLFVEHKTIDKPIIDTKQEYLKNRLICSSSRLNIIDDDIILGYLCKN